MINFLTRRKHRPLASGDSGIAELLKQQHDPHSAESSLFDLEFRREVFQWTAGQVQPQVAPHTWDAFWLSSVVGLPIKDVAAQLGMSIGSVYIARSRVMVRLRERVQAFGRLGESLPDGILERER
jgi:RNA polymerase sigma-70 factor (ECF subfamily)